MDLLFEQFFAKSTTITVFSEVDTPSPGFSTVAVSRTKEELGPGWTMDDVYPPLAELRRTLLTDEAWAAMSSWEKDVWELFYRPDWERLACIEQILEDTPAAQRVQRHEEILEALRKLGESVSECASVATTTSYIDARRAIPVDAASSAIVGKGPEVILAASSGFITTAPATCSTDCLSKPQMAAPVLIAFLSSILTEYDLDTSAMTGVTTSMATTISVSAKSSLTQSLACPISGAITSLSTPSDREDVQEVFEEISEPFGKSQDAAPTVKEHRNAQESAITLAIVPSRCDLPSFRQLDTNATFPLFPWNPGGYLRGSSNQMNLVFPAPRYSHWLVLGVCDALAMRSPFAFICDEWVLPPWPSFMVIYSCESPSDAIMKPSRRCTSDRSPAIIRDVIEFQILAVSESTFMKLFTAILVQSMEMTLKVTSPLAYAKLLRWSSYLLKWTRLCSAYALASMMHILIEASFHMRAPSVHWHVSGESWSSGELIQWLISNIFGACLLGNMYYSDISSINRLYPISKAGFQATASVFYEAMLELQLTKSGNSCVCLHELQPAGSGTEGTAPRRLFINMHSCQLKCHESAALKYKDLWPSTTPVLTEILNMFNSHPSAAVMSELAFAVATNHSCDVRLICSTYPSISAGTVQNLFSAHLSGQHLNDSCLHNGALWNDLMTSSSSRSRPHKCMHDVHLIIVKSKQQVTVYSNCFADLICEMLPRNHQEMMQMQIEWQPRVHAYFIAIELSYKDNGSCCLCWYRGGSALLFWAFGRQEVFQKQEVFQGGRCAVIYIIHCLANDSYLDSLDYLDYNELKVLQVPWDPGVCHVSLSAAFQEVQLHILWDPSGTEPTTAWGQAVFQGGRGVRDPPSTWAWHRYLRHGLGPLICKQRLRNYIYSRRRNEEGIQLDHGGIGSRLPSPASYSHPLLLKFESNCIQILCES